MIYVKKHFTLANYHIKKQNQCIELTDICLLPFSDHAYCIYGQWKGELTGGWENTDMNSIFQFHVPSKGKNYNSDKGSYTLQLRLQYLFTKKK